MGFSRRPIPKEIPVDAATIVPTPTNEPVHDYAPGSPERARLESKLAELAATPQPPAARRA